MGLAKFRVLSEVAPVRAALERCGWNMTHAALALGCHPSTLIRLCARHPALLLEYASRSPGPGRPRGQTPRNGGDNK